MARFWRQVERELVKGAKRSMREKAKEAKPKRVPFTKDERDRIRSRLYRQQDGCCNGCGEHHKWPSNLDIDHICPVAMGGSNRIGNLQLLCRRCNSRKGARHKHTESCGPGAIQPAGGCGQGCGVLVGLAAVVIVGCAAVIRLSR